MHHNRPHCSSLQQFLFLLVTLIILACICVSSVQSTGGGDDDKKYFISKIAGTGSGALTVNVPALEAIFGSISGMAQSKNGDLYVSAGGKHVVLKFEFDKQEGTWTNVTIIAGTGSQSKGPDDVLGTESALNYPMGLSLIEDDSTGEVTAILIAEYQSHRIRNLDMSTQIITTIAGTGDKSFAGDGSPAKDAQFKLPRHVYYDKSTGDIYITDTGNHRIRRVSGGTINTVVGKTCSDGLGDGEQATGACLNNPYSFTMNDAGEWFIADSGNNRIRKVYLNGTITTIAGGGTETGDALATSVKLGSLAAMAVAPSGDVLVADYGVSVIRKMDHSGFMKVIAGGGDQIPSSNNPIPAKTALILPAIVANARDGSDAFFICDNKGFIHKLTSSTKCYGVQSDNSTVCSGHGSCIGTDQCQCDDGWLESNCSIPSIVPCFGIDSDDTSVCSTHGSCIGEDRCKCDNGWMGLDCSITHCFGVTSNVPDVVCSGKGECVSHNKCKCSDGFRGHKCQRPPVSE